MSRDPSVILYAPNIHQGGGKTLLLALLQECGSDVVLCIDRRLQLPLNFKYSSNIHRVSPTLISRFMAEIWLLRFVVKKDLVICLGNLPPFFRLPCHSKVFLQNRYLVEKIALSGFSFATFLRLFVQRFLFNVKYRNADQFIVQTPSMKKLLISKFKDNISVIILPFVAGIASYSRESKYFRPINAHEYDFLYVASGEPHKNHEALISAWGLLANENLYPTLCLTLDESTTSLFLNKLNLTERLKIYNVGVLSHDDVLLLYKKSGALIFPSKLESLGLPLIEARRAGLAILASELDYVRDVLDPDEVFDPDSPVSIARAVKRFLGIEQPPLPLVSAKQFFADASKRVIF
jgi:glycosyltransferase involved in cell wall biosynthesis